MPTRVRKERSEYYKEWRKKYPERSKVYLDRMIAIHGSIAAACENWKRRNPHKVLLSAAKRRAKEKGFEFNIEASDIIMPDKCPILDIPVFRTYNKGRRGFATPNSPSLDRIDNTKGYVKGNIQVISFMANTMKHTATPEQLIKFAYWILKTYGDQHEKDSTK